MDDVIAAESKVAEAKSESAPLNRLRSMFRANENVLEHFVQLALAATIILVEASNTRMVPSLGRVLLDASYTLVVFSAVLSIISVVRGHIFFIQVTNMLTPSVQRSKQ